MTAAERVIAFLDLWDERRRKGGHYSAVIYGLGTDDESVELKDRDIRTALEEAWMKGASEGMNASSPYVPGETINAVFKRNPYKDTP